MDNKEALLREEEKLLEYIREFTDSAVARAYRLGRKHASIELSESLKKRVNEVQVRME